MQHITIRIILAVLLCAMSEQLSRLTLSVLVTLVNASVIITPSYGRTF